jgi:hypothetical protein
VIGPLLPTKPRGVPRVDDRRVLNGSFGDDAMAALVRRERLLVDMQIEMRDARRS